MNRKEITLSVLLVFVFIGIVWLIGCATTEPTRKGGETPVGDVADIDEVLGLTDKKLEEEKNESIAEDDVLRLLGVPEETETKTSQPKKEEKSLTEQLAQQGKEIAAITPKGRDTGVEPMIEKSVPTWKSSSFSDRYQEALQSYRARDYREAIQKFEMLLSMNSKHTLSDNCQYWIGESYYGLGNYQEAIIAFEKVFTFSESNKEDAAQLKLGICYIRLKDTVRAKEEFQKLIDNYPTSEYVSTAKRFIAQIE